MYSFLPGLRGQLISVTSPRRTAWSILVPRGRPFWSAPTIAFSGQVQVVQVLDRGCDSWCWPKGAQPLGTRMSLVSFSSPEPAILLACARDRGLWLHSGQTTVAHFLWLPVTFPFHHTKFPRSTSFTRAISVQSPIIFPLQIFFSRVLLLRQ